VINTKLAKMKSTRLSERFDSFSNYLEIGKDELNNFVFIG